MLALVQADTETDKLSEVQVPDKFYTRLLCDIPILDLIFGNKEMPGILPGSITMVTGVPGGGKTTLMLQLADALNIAAGKRLLYNANEENKAMIKMAADRIRIRGEFSISQRHEVDDLIRYVLEQNVEVLVQDSLQTLSDGQLSGQKLLRSICRKLVRLSKDHDVTVFVVAQVTKGGQAAGPMALVHEVDVHMHIDRNRKTGARSLQMEKNRFGDANVPYEMQLGSSGIEIRAATDDEVQEEQEAPTKTEQRRLEVQTLIRERLLAGDMLSGYDFARFSVDCSGGYWRVQVGLVCELLKQEGYRIGEVRRSGRMHSFVEKAVA
jgi:predicted ATP-dependent serine protease